MGLFRYEAVDRAGKVVHGAMKAPDEQQVARVLAQKGYAARAIHPASGQQKTVSRPPAAQSTPAQQTGGMHSVTIASGVPVSVKSRVSASRLAMFFRQLVTLVRSGIPLYQSFSDMAPVIRDRRLRNALPHIQQSLQAGQSLSSAMAGFPDIFPAHAVASVWSGELAGKLDVVLEDVASDFEQEASDTRFGRIGWGLTKISVILLIATIPLFNMAVLLAPVLDESEADIVGHWLGSYPPVFVSKCLPVILIFLASWIAWGYVKRVPTVRRLLDGMLLRVPVWGKLHRYRSVSRFLHLMDELYAAGINPSTAWNAASIAPRNSEIAEKLRLAREQTPSAGIADLAAFSNVLEPEDVAFIATGEKTGQVPATVGKLAETYADKAASQKTVGRMWSVSLVVAVQLAIGGAALIFMASTYAKTLMKLMGF